MRCTVKLAVTAVVAAALACDQDRAFQGPRPEFAISEARTGGNPHLYFLFPLADDPDVTSGPFNTGLSVSFIVSRLVSETDPACVQGPVVSTIAAIEDAAHERYAADWNTALDALQGGQKYRLCVRAFGTDLGYRDVQPVPPSWEIPDNPQRQPVYRFVNGTTVPVAVRIEQGALCERDAIDCTEGVVGPAGDTLVCDDGLCGVGIPSGALDQPFHFTVELKPCPRDDEGRVDLLPVDIPQFPGCLEITAQPEGDFTAFLAPVLVAACIDAPDLSPEQLARLQLHHLQDDGSVNSLPNEVADFVSATCQGFSDQASRTITGRMLQFAGRALRAINPWLAPPPAYAADQGFGGKHFTCTTTSGAAAAGASLATAAGDSDCGSLSPFVWALPAQMERVGWTDPVARTGDVVTPTVRVSDAGGDPVVDALVTFDVTIGDGPPTAPVSVRTDGAGLASVSWTLGPGGTNELVASGAGIGTMAADGGIGPFAQHHGEPILLGTGQLPFRATVCDAGPTANIADGVIAPGEYRASQSFPVKVSGGTTTATLYWTSDCDHLFIGLEVAAAAELNNGLRLVFDNDGDGIAEVGDDQWNVRRDSRTLLFDVGDRFLSTNCIGSRQSDCGTDDITVGGTNDLSGGFIGFDVFKGVTVYEIRHPLSGDVGHDIQVDPFAGGQLGVYVVLQLGKGPQGNTEYPGFRKYLTLVVPAGS
jgi:hypothetical protein